MNKQLEEIRERYESARSYGILFGFTYEQMGAMLNLVDTQAKQVEELGEQLIRAKDWSTHYFAETIRLEKRVKELQEIITDQDGQIAEGAEIVEYFITPSGSEKSAKTWMDEYSAILKRAGKWLKAVK